MAHAVDSHRTIGHVQDFKVVLITAINLGSNGQLTKGTIVAIRTGTLTRMAIRQMLTAAQSYDTRRPNENGNPGLSARIRGKIPYMPKRSCDDSTEFSQGGSPHT